MDHIKFMEVSQEQIDKFEKLCINPDEDCGRDEVVFDKEVVFDNGFRMAVQVIADNDPDEWPCWTQGVLFDKRGVELGFTDVGGCFAGEYTVWYGDDKYTCNVVPESNKQLKLFE